MVQQIVDSVKRRWQNFFTAFRRTFFSAHEGGEDVHGHVATIDFERMYPPVLSSAQDCIGFPFCTQAALALARSCEPRPY